jgi:hypothetical protein
VDKRLEIVVLRLALVASVPTLAACVNQGAQHPDTVLQKMTPNSSVLILSTSSTSPKNSLASISSGLSLVISRLKDDGSSETITAFFLDASAKPIDIPESNVGVDWRALPSGKYVITVGRYNRYECLNAAPEYYFSVSPGQVLYLGDFHRDGHSLELQGSYFRDVSFFRGHANSATDVDVAPVPVTIKNVDYMKAYPNYHCSSVFFTYLADPHGSPAGATFTVPR